MIWPPAAAAVRALNKTSYEIVTIEAVETPAVSLPRPPMLCPAPASPPPHENNISKAANYAQLRFMNATAEYLSIDLELGGLFTTHLDERQTGF